MATSRKWLITLLFVLITLIPGPILHIFYKHCFISLWPEYALGLSDQKKDIALLLASFSFTMLGFLAAVITIMLSFSKSKAFRRYRDSQRMEIFFALYFLAIFHLGLTFALSLIALSNNFGEVLMQFALGSSANSLVSVGLIAIIIINLCKRAIMED